ncbi:MAG: hypothetical protein HY890_04880 [Deltaproteobacteria bacterium]|nr:hypothetical protein [Deltaproteobacteria bacterium]
MRGKASLLGALLLAAITAVPALTAGAGAPAVLKLDDKIESMKRAGVGPVNFPHARHEKLYKCADCHPKIFKEKVNTSDISMKKNMEGKACGTAKCHDSIKAFPLFQCVKCHTNVKAAR